MSGPSNIGWTNATWNPVRGCERVSEGCRNCYAETLAARHSYEGGWGSEVAEYVTRPGTGLVPRWTGRITTHERQLEVPLKWRKPRRVFVNSMSDLFHDRVPMAFLDRVFAVMAMSSRHTFQILTKRPKRMLEYLSRKDITSRIGHAEFAIAGTGKRTAVLVDSYAGPVHRHAAWPLLNVWLGVSVEDQAAADERIPLLVRTPAAVRWISAEPLLGPVDVSPWLRRVSATDPRNPLAHERLDWVVIGGESGSGRREMDMAHARELGHQCVAAGVPIFVKQDSGPRPAMQGRFTAEEWAIKEYPA